MNAVNGVANFDGNGVKLTGLVGAKTITATSTPGGFTANLSVTLTYGTATKLGVSASTVSATNRVNFAAQPTVTVQDASGNTVENATNTIAVSVTSANSADVALDGTLSASSVVGSRSFADLKLTGKAATYTITYSATGLTSTTQTATLVAGSATRMVLDRAAAAAVNGNNFTTQPVVKLLDADDNLTTSTATVSISVSTGVASGNAVLGGTFSLAASAGTASFSTVKLTGTVDTYVLTYSSTGLSNITQSLAVTIGAPTQLILTTQAAGFANRTNFTTQPVVSVADIGGNVVTASSAAIAVAISSANLTGTTTVNAVNGVADWATAATALGKSGTIGSKTLTFSSSGLTDATQTFTLTLGVASQLAMTSPATLVNDTVKFNSSIIKVAGKSPSIVRVSSGDVIGTKTCTFARGKCPFGSNANDNTFAIAAAPGAIVGISGIAQLFQPTAASVVSRLFSPPLLSMMVLIEFCAHCVIRDFDGMT
jgi:hypothetical protein